jgi:hypothetical protein
MSVVVCARCGHVCGLSAWRARHVERRITSEDLAGQVSAWPDGVVVEVRACGGCGGAIARIVGARGGAARAAAVQGG